MMAEKIIACKFDSNLLFSNYFLGNRIVQEYGYAEADVQKMFRAIGCVLGAFVGDAAGAVLEFLD